jgi:hypothetical protein
LLRKIGLRDKLVSPAMIDPKAKQRFKPVIAEFRRGIALHRAEGATEARIKQLLGESIWLAFQEVEDPELRAWLCDEFSKAARVSPIVAIPAKSAVH